MSDTTTIVIFGSSGDLTWRKLIPAYFNLYVKGRLPEDWRIVGSARSEMSDEALRERLRDGVEKFAADIYDAETWAAFAARVYYVSSDLTRPGDFEALAQRLTALEDGPANRLYYLAVAPRFIAPAVDNLGAAGLVDESDGWRRVVVEKPFGSDQPSARALNESIRRVLDEDQIYRIDHYLGKETVQNILVFRFANGLFEPVWNRNYIDHVQITAAESVDVGHRADYYDTVGVMRDMMQNHMLQLLSLVAIEPPASFGANALRNEKLKLLMALRPLTSEEICRNSVRAQYEGYRDAEGVGEGSETPTYAALRLFIDNWRWQGVPFYVRSGKALARKATEITIVFKEPPHLMFPMPDDAHLEKNHLSLCIQPDEGVHFSFQVKVPDAPAELEMQAVDMTFHYRDYFPDGSLPEAYERLLMDVLKGDASLFTRGDNIELAWGLIDGVLSAWTTDEAPPLVTYERGGWGPAAADAMLNRDGARWIEGCEHS